MSNTEKYPEHGISGRIRLMNRWLPEDTYNLLDGGCSYGYGTRFYRKPGRKVYGIDIDPDSIQIATERYPDINFSCSKVESTPFEDCFFNTIILSDVLEHVENPIDAIDEMFRLLKAGGTLIISTPHKGMFQYFDPYNYGYYLKKNFKAIYAILFKIIRLIKSGKIPKEFNPSHEQKHNHYNKKDLTEMLDASNFKGNYKINKVFRYGFFYEALAINLERLFNIFTKKDLTRSLLKPLFALSNIDNKINYGALSYSIAIRIKKNQC